MKAIVSEMVKTWDDVIKEFENNILPKMRAGSDFVIDYRPCCEPYSDVFVPNGLLVYLQDGSQLIYLFEPGKDQRW